MKQVRVKILPGIGAAQGKWEVIEFDQLILFHLPNLSLSIYSTKQFPPFHILNEELMSGGKDQGMSGGCFWKPFKLTEEEYQEIFLEMMTNPDYNLEFDQSLETAKNLHQWREAVLAKSYSIRRK